VLVVYSVSVMAQTKEASSLPVSEISKNPYVLESLHPLSRDLKWGMGAFFQGFFDNREYAGSMLQKSQTYGGVQVGILGELKFKNRYGLYLGGILMWEFGAPKPTYFDLIAYFQTQYPSFIDFKIGFIPADFLKNELPDYFFQHQAWYFHPTIAGMQLILGTPLYKQTVYLDWFGRQSEKNREMFSLGTLGRYYLIKDKLFLRNIFTLNHIAGDLDPNSLKNVRDNIHLALGIWSKPFESSLTRYQIPLKIELSADYLLSHDKLRDIYDTGVLNNMAVNARMSFWYAFLGVKFFLGHGFSSYFGDPFYYPIFEHPRVPVLRTRTVVETGLKIIGHPTWPFCAYLNVNIQFAENHIYTQQMVVLTVYLHALYERLTKPEKQLQISQQSPDWTWY